MVCPGRVRYNKNAAAFPLRGGGPRPLLGMAAAHPFHAAGGRTVPRAAPRPFLLLLSKKAMLYERFTNKTTKI